MIIHQVFTCIFATLAFLQISETSTTNLDLNEHLKPISSCLVFVTNHANRNLQNINFPIFVRHFNYTLLLQKKSLLGVDTSTINITIFKCPSSLLHGEAEWVQFSYYRMYYSYGICGKIKFLKFVGNMKPWLCEATVDNEPTKILTKKWRDTHFLEREVLNIWHLDDKEQKLETFGVVPLAHPRLHILITKPSHFHFVSQESTLVKNWVNAITWAYTSFFPKSELFFVFELRSKPALDSLINNTYVVKLTRETYKNISTSLQSIQHIKIISFTDIVILSKRFSTTANYKINLANSFLEKGVQCSLSNFPTTSSYQRFRAALQISNLQSLVGYGYDVMLLHLFKNSTVKDPCKRYVAYGDNRFSVLIIRECSLPQIAPYSPFPSTKFVFVYCDTLTYRELMFKELLTSFDFGAWMVIVCALLVFVPLVFTMFENIERNESTQVYVRIYFERIQSSFMALVEQGDCFPSKVANKFHMRWFISGYFIAVLVLSNAYKRENILKMLRPVRRNVFDNISEIAASSFKIYSRASIERFGKDCGRNMTECNRYPFFPVRGYSGHKFNNSKNVVFSSEVYSYWGNMKWEQFLNLRQISEIDPDVLHDGYIKQEKGQWGLDDHMLLQHQTDHFYRKLEKCQKSAVILPELVALGVHKKLRNTIDLKRKIVHVSTEALFQVGKCHHVSESDGYSKLMSKEAADNIERYRATGILVWWHGFVDWMINVKKDDTKGKLDSTSEVDVATSASMDGNIKVIFAVMMCGLAVSVIGMVSELCVNRCFS